MMYGKQSCSEDGTSVSMPFYSDPNCNVETDMNTHGGCANSIPGVLSCTFPAHMTFQSGVCTRVIDGLVAQASWKVTITDCAGDEISKILAALGGGFIFIIVVVCCCIGGCIYMCVQSSKKKNAAAMGPGIYATPA